VRRIDGRVLSILEEEKGVINGEDYTAYDSITYDAVTGKVLGLEDVVSDTAAFWNAIAEGCGKQGLSKEAFDNALNARTEQGEELSWTVEPQGVTVWFDSGELDDKASGSHQVQLLFSEAEGMFTDKYCASEGKQTTMLPVGSLMFIGGGSDGTKELLSITAQYDENQYMQDVEITLGDKTYVEDEIFTYDIRPYLLLTDTGKSMLYIEYRFDNDYRSIGIYDLNGGEPRLVDMTNDHFLLTFDEAEDQSVNYLFTNPDGFKLATRLDLLSTIDGYKDAHIDDDGRPVYDSDEYSVARDLTITTKRAITVDLVDKNSGQVTAKDVEIPEGSPLKLYSSDNKTYVDAITDKDERVRIYVDTANDWPLTVNGTDIFECFDGMIFAG
jgi:hypothetical protein